MKAQLPKSNIDIGQLKKYVLEDRYVLQEKFDGHRILVNLSADPSVWNRNGEYSQHTSSVLASLRKMTIANIEATLDGEWLSQEGVLHIFDAPSLILQGRPYSTTRMAYAERLNALRIFSKYLPEHIRLVPTSYSSDEKMTLLREVMDSKGEGVVIKDLAAPYAEGRTNNIIKCKFYKTVDVIVDEVELESKNNFSFRFTDRNSALGTAKNLYGVEPGDVVEVRYLRHSEEGRLVQPVLMRKRKDKDPAEATADQLES